MAPVQPAGKGGKAAPALNKNASKGELSEAGKSNKSKSPSRGKDK